MSIVLDGTSGLTSPAAVLTTTPLAVTSGGTGVTTSTGSGANVLGTSPQLTTPSFSSTNGFISLPTIIDSVTAAAPLYFCRAWVNFNGTGTVAIRASGNVSSITDNGTGDYTVNFTTAMPDVNYSVAGICSTPSAVDFVYVLNTRSDVVPTTTTLPIFASYTNTSGTRHDSVLNYIAIFR